LAECKVKARMPDHSSKPDLAVEFLAHMQMNETKDYVVRGRPLSRSTDQELADAWVASFERWFSYRNDRDALRIMDDADAELRLRGLSPPNERVEAQTKALQNEIQRLHFNARSEELDRDIAEFFEARDNPKN
jgi:hypothetical protein